MIIPFILITTIYSFQVDYTQRAEYQLMFGLTTTITPIACSGITFAISEDTSAYISTIDIQGSGACTLNQLVSISHAQTTNPYSLIIKQSATGFIVNGIFGFFVKDFQNVLIKDFEVNMEGTFYIDIDGSAGQRAGSDYLSKLRMISCKFDGTSTISSADIRMRGYLQLNITHIHQYSTIFIQKCKFINLYSESISMLNINTPYQNTNLLSFTECEITQISLDSGAMFLNSSVRSYLSIVSVTSINLNNSILFNFGLQKPQGITLDTIYFSKINLNESKILRAISQYQDELSIVNMQLNYPEAALQYIYHNLFLDLNNITIIKSTITQFFQSSLFYTEISCKVFNFTFGQNTLSYVDLSIFDIIGQMSKMFVDVVILTENTNTQSQQNIIRVVRGDVKLCRFDNITFSKNVWRSQLVELANFYWLGVYNISSDENLQLIQSGDCINCSIQVNWVIVVSTNQFNLMWIRECYILSIQNIEVNVKMSKQVLVWIWEVEQLLFGENVLRWYSECIQIQNISELLIINNSINANTNEMIFEIGQELSFCIMKNNQLFLNSPESIVILSQLQYYLNNTFIVNNALVWRTILLFNSTNITIQSNIFNFNTQTQILIYAQNILFTFNNLTQHSQSQSSVTILKIYPIHSNIYFYFITNSFQINSNLLSIQYNQLVNLRFINNSLIQTCCGQILTFYSMLFQSYVYFDGFNITLTYYNQIFAFQLKNIIMSLVSFKISSGSFGYFDIVSSTLFLNNWKIDQNCSAYIKCRNSVININELLIQQSFQQVLVLTTFLVGYKSTIQLNKVIIINAPVGMMFWLSFSRLQINNLWIQQSQLTIMNQFYSKVRIGNLNSNYSFTQLGWMNQSVLWLNNINMVNSEFSSLILECYFSNISIVNFVFMKNTLNNLLFLSNSFAKIQNVNISYNVHNDSLLSLSTSRIYLVNLNCLNNNGINNSQIILQYSKMSCQSCSFLFNQVLYAQGIINSICFYNSSINLLTDIYMSETNFQNNTSIYHASIYQKNCRTILNSTYIDFLDPLYQLPASLQIVISTYQLSNDQLVNISQQSLPNNYTIHSSLFYFSTKNKLSFQLPLQSTPTLLYPYVILKTIDNQICLIPSSVNLQSPVYQTTVYSNGLFQFPEIMINSQSNSQFKITADSNDIKVGLYQGGVLITSNHTNSTHHSLITINGQFEQCYDWEIVEGSECFSCGPNQIIINKKCVLCDAIMICKQGQLIGLQNGYYMLSYGNYLQCENCNNGECTIGYAGYLCYNCAANYFWFESSCELCSSGQNIIFIALGMLSIFMLSAYLAGRIKQVIQIKFIRVVWKQPGFIYYQFLEHGYISILTVYISIFFSLKNNWNYFSYCQNGQQSSYISSSIAAFFVFLMSLVLLGLQSLIQSAFYQTLLQYSLVIFSFSQVGVFNMLFEHIFYQNINGQNLIIADINYQLESGINILFTFSVIIPFCLFSASMVYFSLNSVKSIHNNVELTSYLYRKTLISVACHKNNFNYYSIIMLSLISYHILTAQSKIPTDMQPTYSITLAFTIFITTYSSQPFIHSIENYTITIITLLITAYYVCDFAQSQLGPVQRTFLILKPIYLYLIFGLTLLMYLRHRIILIVKRSQKLKALKWWSLIYKKGLTRRIKEPLLIRQNFEIDEQAALDYINEYNSDLEGLRNHQKKEIQKNKGVLTEENDEFSHVLEVIELLSSKSLHFLNQKRQKMKNLQNTTLNEMSIKWLK